MTNTQGVLFLCPTPIGNLEDISLRVLRVLREADLIACEDTRHTLKLLNHYEIRKKLVSYHEHNKEKRKHTLAQAVADGKKVALVTDAGMPGISDPGEDLVGLFIEEGLPFEVLPGPSAFVNALVASGLPARRFVFEGFLERDKKERKASLERLKVETRTMVLYEAPHRLRKTLEELSEVLGPERTCVLCRELTKRHEEHQRGTLGQLAAMVLEQPPRGEYVLILQGGTVRQVSFTDDMLLERLEIQRQAGLRNKEAVKKVALETGVSRNRLYALSIRRE